LETGGERCGIIQISKEIFRIQNNEAEVEVNVFNEYVNPGREAVWNDQACITSHGLSPGHEKIVNANIIDFVWKSFEKFIDANIGSDQVRVLIAWNGEGCDMRWLYIACDVDMDVSRLYFSLVTTDKSSHLFHTFLIKYQVLGKLT